jgi:hypothetical protein
MDNGKIKMVISYFNFKTVRCFNDKRIMEYESKSTHKLYYFEVNEESVDKYNKGKGVVNSEVEKLINSLICIIRDERTSVIMSSNRTHYQSVY